IAINKYNSEYINLSTADSWYARGLSLYAMKRYQDSINSFDKAIALKPNFPDAIKARNIAQKQLQ
ncbi:MAG: tetratricopeptide repeat protein, partial [Pseudanabaena sp. RU_4_16]|nr:tetratricopeptide repeat protein [Pseudanabaena sp. RU_4_16]